MLSNSGPATYHFDALRPGTLYKIIATRWLKCFSVGEIVELVRIDPVHRSFDIKPYGLKDDFPDGKRLGCAQWQLESLYLDMICEKHFVIRGEEKSDVF